MIALRLFAAIGVCFGALAISGPASATILGPSVNIFQGLSPSGNQGQMNAFQGSERLCHQAPGRLEGWVSDLQWVCTWDGHTLVRIGDQTAAYSSVVAVGSTVVFSKADVVGLITTSATAPSAGSFARDVARVRWSVDGVTVSDETSAGPATIWSTGHSCLSPCEYGWVRQRAISFSRSFPTIGSFPISLRVDYTDGSFESAEGAIDVVADAATAVLTVDPAVTLTGSQVALHATSSSTLSGVISSYEWDFDGDGRFEGSGAATTSHAWLTAGTKTVGVRVTSRGGSTSTTTISVEVRKAPPEGEPGFSINDGSPYTNSRAVQLALVWPAFATQARVSNDGGFARAKTEVRELEENVPWALDDSVVGVFTKNVYVRFSGSTIDTTKTFYDDIILDTNAPKIESASMVAGSGVPAVSLRGVRASRKANFLVSLKAKDDKSGVAIAQFNSRPSVAGARSTAFATRIRVRATSSLVWLRVRDGAGNFSKWRKLSKRVG